MELERRHDQRRRNREHVAARPRLQAGATPRASAAFTTRSACAASSSCKPHMQPRPRTAIARPLATISPSRRSINRFELRALAREARAARVRRSSQAPRRSPSDCRGRSRCAALRRSTRATRPSPPSLAIAALIGKPPPIALPMQMMSGVTPSCSQANQCRCVRSPCRSRRRSAACRARRNSARKPREIAGRRHDAAAAPLNRLDDHRCDVVVRIRRAARVRRAPLRASVRCASG